MLLAQWLGFFFLLMLVSIFAGQEQPTRSLHETLTALWVITASASLLWLPYIWREEWEQGIAEQWAIRLPSLIPFILTKMLCHWLYTGVLLALCTPIAIILLHGPEAHIATIMLSILLGSGLFSLLGVNIATLTLGLRRSGSLLGLLLLPLYVPIIIFASSLVYTSSAHNLAYALQTHLPLFAGLYLVLVPLTLLASQAALRIALEE